MPAAEAWKMEAYPFRSMLAAFSLADDGTMRHNQDTKDRIRSWQPRQSEQQRRERKHFAHLHSAEKYH